MRRQKNTIILLMAFIMAVFSSSALMANEPISDKEISNAIYNELMFNATTPAHLIDVETTNGIVTLTGSVDNILAEDRAVKIARTVKGVRAVVDNIKVNAPYKADFALERAITDALYKDPATDSYEVMIKAKNGKITLTGEVDSWQEKKLTEFVAKGIKGVKKVNNQITVNYTEERGDFEIKEDVESTLKSDIRVDDALINVKVKNSKVTLSGTVGSANEKALAITDAWTMGVDEVDSKNLTVESWARDEKFRKNKYVPKKDIEIKEAVKDALMLDPRVYSFNPEVSVKNGQVTLTGKVDNLKAKRAAKQDAKNVVGVISVKNFLRVRPAFIPEDSELESEIKSAFMQNPIVEKWDLTVKANNGVIYLNGYVDSHFERNQAEEIASKTKGVIEVKNNLSVYDANDEYFYNYYGWNTYYPPYQVDITNDYVTDTEITDNIKSQLWWSPYVNQDDVDVVVIDGVATLEGKVDTEREKLFAEINALEGGADEVTNNIEVEYK